MEQNKKKWIVAIVVFVIIIAATLTLWWQWKNIRNIPAAPLPIQQSQEEPEKEPPAKKSITPTAQALQERAKGFMDVRLAGKKEETELYLTAAAKKKNYSLLSSEQKQLNRYELKSADESGKVEATVIYSEPDNPMREVLETQTWVFENNSWYLDSISSQELREYEPLAPDFQPATAD